MPSNGVLGAVETLRMYWMYAVVPGDGANDWEAVPG